MTLAARLAHVGCALLLSTAFASQQTAGAVPEDVMTLLRRGAMSMPGDDVELRVGSAPDGFPVELLPAGTDVFVASISARVTVVAGVASNQAATARAGETARLAGTGWIDATPSLRGFVSGPVDQPHSVCRGSDFASVLVMDRPGGGSLVRVSITKDPRRACLARQEFSFPDVTIPKLTAPLGLKTYGGGGGGTLDSLDSRLRVETTSSPRAIAAHYASQLEAAGWKVEGRADDGNAMCVMRFSTTSRIGDRITGVLSVIALQGTPYLDLTLHIVRNGPVRGLS